MVGCAIQREIVTQRSPSWWRFQFHRRWDNRPQRKRAIFCTVCVQYPSYYLEVMTQFLGFYNAPDSTAEILTKVIKDILLRLQLPLEHLQEFCFDGASNMSGRISGVQARLKKDCKDALYVHCSNHSLDLALQQVGREITIVADTLVFFRKVSNTMRESAKSQSLFRGMFEDGAVRLLGLCLTRWCVRVSAIKRSKSHKAA